MIARHVRTAIAATLLIAAGAAQSARSNPDAGLFDGRSGRILALMAPIWSKAGWTGAASARSGGST